jgi:hypothetical protein
MKAFTLKLNRKEEILAKFSRTLVQQKPKVQSNKKQYKREKFNYREEV